MVSEQGETLHYIGSSLQVLHHLTDVIQGAWTRFPRLSHGKAKDIAFIIGISVPVGRMLGQRATPEVGSEVVAWDDPVIYATTRNARAQIKGKPDYEIGIKSCTY